MGVRGTKDYYGPEQRLYALLKKKFQHTANLYGAQFIQTSVMENADLFIRTAGNDSDICNKEMFVVNNKNTLNTEVKSEEIVLKPEGTAPAIRALFDQRVIFNQFLRVAYFDRMYRYSRPQKGRLREFTQAGVEFFGSGYIVDFEAIKCAWDFLDSLSLTKHVTLHINSIGTSETRKQYSKALLEYFEEKKNLISEQTYEKALENPLRALDKLTEREKSLLPDLPNILSYLNPENKQHFEKVCELLDEHQIPYTLNPTIIRGLDYYTDTVFEVLYDEQAVLAGGRYNGLVNMLAKQDCNAIGWAAGIERLILAITDHQTIQSPAESLIYLVNLDTDSRCLKLANDLREHNINTLILSCKIDKVFKQADQNRVPFVIISGSNEQQAGTFFVKDMNAKTTNTISENEIVNSIKTALGQQG